MLCSVQSGIPEAKTRNRLCKTNMISFGLKKKKNGKILEFDVNVNVLADWMTRCALATNPRIGPKVSANDGGGMLNKFGAGHDFNGNGLTGTATWTGNTIGDFLSEFKITAAFPILATFTALAAFKAPTFNAIVFLATRNGAVMALNAASFVALAYAIWL